MTDLGCDPDVLPLDPALFEDLLQCVSNLSLILIHGRAIDMPVLQHILEIRCWRPSLPSADWKFDCC